MNTVINASNLLTVYQFLKEQSVPYSELKHVCPYLYVECSIYFVRCHIVPREIT
jgi:hypothetical protein